MSGFLYFIPGRKTPPAADELADLGLAHLAREKLSCRECLAGPEGKSGLILGLADDDSLGYFPDRQTWEKMPALRTPHSALWMGFSPSSPPAPADLARSEQIDGYWVELGASSEIANRKSTIENPRWIVPLARRFPEGSAFPQTLSLGVDGKLVREIVPAFVSASKMADEIWASIQFSDTGDPKLVVEDAKAFSWACEILAINYRVGPAEVSALKLLTTANLVRVLACFVDMPTYLAAQAARVEAESKKKDADTPAG